MRAKDFGPQRLIAVREAMIDRDWRRVIINQQIGRIRRCFKWGQQEIVPPEVLTALETVPGLRAGRTAAKESSPVIAVSDAPIEAVRRHLSRQVWAMIQLQRVTGMRPGEVTAMRGCDLTVGDQLWEYVPESHKTQHHGRERVIQIGPQAEAIIRPFLKADTTAYLFSPATPVSSLMLSVEPTGSRG